MIKITDVAHHRNGISGAPFHVITFREGEARMVGVVFDEPGTDALGRGEIAFGVNSYRGDVYEGALRSAIGGERRKA